MSSRAFCRFKKWTKNPTALPQTTQLNEPSVSRNASQNLQSARMCSCMVRPFAAYLIDFVVIVSLNPYRLTIRMNNDDYSSSSLGCDMHEQSRIADVYLLIFGETRWRLRAHTLPHDIKAKYRRPLCFLGGHGGTRHDSIFFHGLNFVILSRCIHAQTTAHTKSSFATSNALCFVAFLCATQCLPKTHRQIPAAGARCCSFIFREWHSFVSIFNIYVDRGSAKIILMERT